MIKDDILKSIKDNMPFYYANAIDSDIFSWSELESLINLRPFMSTKRFIPITKEQEEYKWDIPAWQTERNSWPPYLIEKFIDNNVCYIRECSRVNKNINDICYMLEKHTKCPTDAHIYFSTKPILNSFDKHFDESHNVIIQIDGETNFKIYKDDNIIMDVIMKPGDLIYIPTKWYHQAISKTKRLSISFPLSLTGTLQERKWLTIN